MGVRRHELGDWWQAAGARPFIAALGLALLCLAAAACSDRVETDFRSVTPSTATPTRTVGPLNTANPSQSPTPARTSTHITAITPQNGAQVRQRATRALSSGGPSGVCFEANWADLPEQRLWFQMAVDGRLTTTQVDWHVADEAATEGTGCFAPPQGLKTGLHQVAVSVQDPNANRAPSEIVSWQFEVVPDAQ